MVPPGPSDPAYQLSVGTARDGVLVARVSGELDYGWIPALRRHLFDLVTPEVGLLVVDLSDVQLLSAAAMEMLLSLDVLAGASGCETRIVAATRAVRRPLTLIGLHERLRLYDSLAAALEPPQ